MLAPVCIRLTVTVIVSPASPVAGASAIEVASAGSSTVTTGLSEDAPPIVIPFTSATPVAAAASFATTAMRSNAIVSSLPGSASAFVMSPKFSVTLWPAPVTIRVGAAHEPTEQLSAGEIAKLLNATNTNPGGRTSVRTTVGFAPSGTVTVTR